VSGRKRRRRQKGFWESVADDLSDAVDATVGFVVDNAPAIAVGLLLGVIGKKALDSLDQRRRTIYEQILDNVEADKQNPGVMEWVRQFIVGDEQNDDRILEKLMTWMADPANMTWKRDSTRDRAYDFFTIVGRKGGDCDDYASFFCTALEASGIHTSFVLLPGDVVEGVEQQGHIVCLVRTAQETPETTDKFGKDERYVLTDDGGISYYWLLCDPQMGRPGEIGQKWREKLARGAWVFHNRR
jgi:hypothetical protein